MVRLMRHRRKDFLVLYDLRGVSSYFHGYMVPSTGYLRYFALTPYSDSPGSSCASRTAAAWSWSRRWTIPS